MKFAIAFAAVLAVASAQFAGFGQPQLPRQPPRVPAPVPRPAAPVASRVSSSDQAANVLRYDNDISPDGAFNYAFETDNGIASAAQGTPRDFGGNPPLVPVVHQGNFAWTSPEGQPISISYIADENGYQPSGDSLPTPHPIPEAIARSLDYLARNAPKK